MNCSFSAGSIFALLDTPVLCGSFSLHRIPSRVVPSVHLAVWDASDDPSVRASDAAVLVEAMTIAVQAIEGLGLPETVYQAVGER